MSQAVIELEITKERLRIIPLALAEAVKPLERSAT
jgi:flotillin